MDLKLYCLYSIKMLERIKYIVVLRCLLVLKYLEEIAWYSWPSTFYKRNESLYREVSCLGVGGRRLGLGEMGMGFGGSLSSKVKYIIYNGHVGPPCGQTDTIENTTFPQLRFKQESIPVGWVPSAFLIQGVSLQSPLGLRPPWTKTSLDRDSQIETP